MNLNATEKEIFVRLLGQASDELGNNSCNDYPITVTKDNEDHLRGIIKEIAEGYDEDYKEHMLSQIHVGQKVYFQDWMLIDLLKNKIEAA